MIRGVLKHEVPVMLEFIRPYFDSFAERSQGELTAEELLLQVVQGKRQCWVAISGDRVKACALTEVLANPKKTVVLNFCAGEDRHEWRDDMVAEIENWAESLGSERVRIVCRPGWAREIKGYRETHRTIEKDI